MDGGINRQQFRQRFSIFGFAEFRESGGTAQKQYQFKSSQDIGLIESTWERRLTVLPVPQPGPYFISSTLINTERDS